jgi:hypothetical protein
MSTPIRPAKPKNSSSPETIPDLVPSPIFWIIAGLVMACLFGVYSPSLDFQFILDDHRFLSDPRIQSSGHLLEYFTNYVWAQVIGGPPSFYRPIFVLWLRINYILNETSSWGWHLLSVGKHALVAVLLGLLVWKLLRDRAAVLIAAALFALHPSHTESVAWVTVPDALMAAAFLGSVIFFLDYLDQSSRGNRPQRGKPGRKTRDADRQSQPVSKSLIASVVVCFIAFLTKETAIVLPAILFVVALIVGDPAQADAKCSQGWSRFRIALQRTWPFFAALAVYFFLRLNALGWRIENQTQHLPVSSILLSVPGILWFYIQAMAWPIRSYAFGNTDDIGIVSARTVFLPVVGVCIFIALIAWLVQWSWRKARSLAPRDQERVHFSLAAGVPFLIFPILLALNLNGLNPGDFLHGRYAYLSLLGLMLLLATGFHFSGRMRRPLLVLAGILVVAFAALTISQEGMWQDELTIYKLGNQNAPRNTLVKRNFVRARVEAALKLTDEGQCGDAIPTFEEGTREFPNDWVSWAALGDCYYHLNNLPKAEAYLHRAADLAQMPRVTEQWEHVRAEMEASGQTPKAMRQ